MGVNLNRMGVGWDGAEFIKIRVVGMGAKPNLMRIMIYVT